MKNLLCQSSHVYGYIYFIVMVLTSFFAIIDLCQGVDTNEGSTGTALTSENKAYNYLYEVMDKYQKGDAKRLLDSYESNSNEDDGDTAWVYDNDIVALSLMARGFQEDWDRAKIILDSLIYCQTHDPFFNDYRLRDAYHARQLIDENGNSLVASPGSGAGNMAWTIIAWLRYWEVKHNPSYLEAAERLGKWLYENCYDLVGPGGYTGGFGGSEPKQEKFLWKSTEHNEDIYAALIKLYKSTGKENWLQRAMEAKNFVISMWNENDKHFWTGTIEDGDTINRDILPADVNIWGILTLGEKNKYGDSIKWLVENCNVERDGFIGFDFDTDQDSVWFEGTAHAILALQSLGKNFESEIYLEQIRSAQKTAINANGKGIVSSPIKTSTGLGWDFPNMLHIGATAWYLLAERHYNPFWQVNTNESIPYDGVTIVTKFSTNQSRTINFSGYEWKVKSGKHLFGPGPNYFSNSNDNVWVDTQDRLHLKIKRYNGRWFCAEVVSKQSFGYGTYRFYLDSRVDSLDPNVVLGLFTWSDSPEYDHREIDVECAKWGNADNNINAQFVVQPYDMPDHCLRFAIPPETKTMHNFTWKPGSVFFQSIREHNVISTDSNNVIFEWECNQGIPEPGGENARINLWLIGGNAPISDTEVELIISKFEFVPLK